MKVCKIAQIEESFRKPIVLCDCPTLPYAIRRLVVQDDI